MTVMKRLLLLLLLAAAAAWTSGPAHAGYKARRWDVRAKETYPAKLTSEGVTIAVEPLFSDALAAQVFDKNDIVTRGIMPLAVAVFNDNDFAVEIDGMSIEIIHGRERLRTLTPNEVVYRLFRKQTSWINRPIPRVPRSQLNIDALEDFDSKFLMRKVVEPRSRGGGFLYFHIGGSADAASYLADSTVYIPDIYRLDDGSRLIYFEIELKPAVSSGAVD